MQQLKTKSSLPELKKLAKSLKKDLIPDFIPARFHDNIFGRAFETAFIESLVDNTPDEVGIAMTKLCQKLATSLTELKKKPQEAKEFRKRLVTYLKCDKRFWFPKVAFTNMMDPNGDPLQALIDFLKTPKTTGIESLSIPYLLVTIGLAMRKSGVEPDWLKKATDNYRKNLGAQSSKVRVDHKGTKLIDKQAGITLKYQPPLSKHQWMSATTRPVLTRKPNLDISSHEHSRKALIKGMSQGIPWVSGLSGSTNITLYCLKSLDPKGTIDAKAILLGTVMFLVYDGGHSAHESLWTAHQVNQKLHFGFNFSNAKHLSDFISDYQKFAAMYTDSMRFRIEEAFDEAFDKVIDYFNTYSSYA